MRITPEDLTSGRAYIHLSTEAKLALCHKAGAPWSNKDPDAELHDLQREVIGRPEREKIVHGASRLGKSVLGGCESIIEAMLPFTKTAIVAARYDHVSHEFQYTYAGMRELFKGNPQAFKRLIYRHSQNYHDYECSTIWGSEVRGFSTDSDDGAALLGQEFTRVILGEGSHISQSILEKKIMRAIDGALMVRADGFSRETGKLSIYTTPKGYEGCSAAEWERVNKQTRRHPEKLHYDKVPYAQTVWIREADIRENPAYDLRVFAARQKSLDKAAFEEQYLGRMTFASGRVYTEFNEDEHVAALPSADEIRTMRLGVGIDTGAYYAAFLCGVDRDGRVWQLGETYTQKVHIRDSCEVTREMIVEVLGPVFNTTDYMVLKEAVEWWIVDPASQHKIELMDELDVTVSTPTRGQGKFDLLPTVDIVRSLFQTRMLRLSVTCDWTIDQIKKYVWKNSKTVGSKDPVIREPRKDYDHLMDAMRFIVVPLWELGPADGPVVTLTPAQRLKENHRESIWGPLKAEMEAAEQRRQGAFNVILQSD